MILISSEFYYPFFFPSSLCGLTVGHTHFVFLSTDMWCFEGLCLYIIPVTHHAPSPSYEYNFLISKLLFILFFCVFYFSKHIGTLTRRTTSWLLYNHTISRISTNNSVKASVWDWLSREQISSFGIPSWGLGVIVDLSLDVQLHGNNDCSSSGIHLLL